MLPVLLLLALEFTAPPGWQRADKDGASYFTPPGLRSGESALIAVAPGRELSGGFPAAFRQMLDAALRGQRVRETAEPRALGPDLLLCTVRLEDPAGKLQIRDYAGYRAGGRVEFAVLLVSSEELFSRYRPVFETFAASLRVPVAKPGPALAGGLEGVYVSNQGRYQWNAFSGQMDFKVSNEFYMFWPDGRLYYGLPAGGLEGFTPPAGARESGSYRISGAAIETRFPNWSGFENWKAYAYARDAQSVSIAGTRFDRVAPEHGLRLEGVYRRRSFVNTSSTLGGSQGGVAGETRIAFRGDGRFTKQGFVGFSAVRGASAAGSVRDSGEGTYRITGNTLDLTFSDGRRERYTFYRVPREEAQVIALDGSNFVREP